MRKLVKTIMGAIDRVFRWICKLFPRVIREGFIERFHRLWTYGFFGCINTAIDYGLYSLLYYVLGVPVLIAQAVGLICGSSNGYLLNSTITFEEGRGRTKGQYFQYVGVDIVLALLTGAFMQWAETHIDLPMILIKVIMTAVVTVIHYLVYKKLVFRIRKDERHE
ncbi:MAG: GtrA family protein [Clostridia bacterium]|nr:GtrA family protein [Clostridia bacterium]